MNTHSTSFTTISKTEPSVKYTLGDATTYSANGKTYRLFRLVAARDIPLAGICKGDVGGWVDGSDVLSQDGDCWIGGESVVAEGSVVKDDAQVSGKCLILDNCVVSGNASVADNVTALGHVEVSGNSSVSGVCAFENHVQISGNASVCGDGQVLRGAGVARAVKISGNASVSGAGSLVGNIHVSGNAAVEGHVEVEALDGLVAVAGCTLLADNAKIKTERPCLFGGNCAVRDKVTIRGSVNISGNSTLKGNTVVDVALGSVEINGDTTLNNCFVTAAASFNGGSFKGQSFDKAGRVKRPECDGGSQRVVFTNGGTTIITGGNGTVTINGKDVVINGKRVQSEEDSSIVGGVLRAIAGLFR